MIGCDLAQLDDFTLNLLTNDEVLAVDQDPLGKQGRCILQEDGFEVWVKDLADGSKAVGIFNLRPQELEDDPGREYGLAWQKIGVSGPQSVRDLWRRALSVATDPDLRIARRPGSSRLRTDRSWPELFLATRRRRDSKTGIDRISKLPRGGAPDGRIRVRRRAGQRR